MADRIPLTQLRRSAEKISGRTIPVLYRDIYRMALDGVFPASQINGRWYANSADVSTIAKTLAAEASKNVTA